MRRHKKTELKVLIVEDEIAPRRMLKLMLGKAKGVSYEIKEADSLSTTYLMLSDEDYRPDVIILDLNLKDSTGMGTFRALTMRYPRIAVLIHSGIHDRAVSTEAIELGADYIVKGQITPYNLDLRIRNAMLAKENSILHGEREAHYQKTQAVQEAMLTQVTQLITACSKCAKVKDISIDATDDPMAQWIPLIQFLSRHGVDLTHGYCPQCMGSIIDGMVVPDLQIQEAIKEDEGQTGQAQPKAPKS